MHRRRNQVLILLSPAASLILASAAVTSAQDDLDARRLRVLRAIDRDLVARAGDPSLPGPNRILRPGGAHHGNYLAKALAILGRVAVGDAPAGRRAEANQLLRFSENTWAGDAYGQYASGWNHRDRTLGVRLYLLYADRLDADVRRLFEASLRTLLREPYERSSENIRFTTNAAVYLAHEALGERGAPTYAPARNWLRRSLRTQGEQGSFEYGSPYNGWTMGAILNLADFAEDAEVRARAWLVLDHHFASLSGQVRIRGAALTAVRRYDHWTLGANEAQLVAARLLFGGLDDALLQDQHLAEWAVSRYRPLRAVARLYEVEEIGASRLRQDRFTHYTWRGADFLLSTLQAIGARDNFALPSGGTHDIVSVYVQSRRAPRAHVVPVGIRVGRGAPKKQRARGERAFGHEDVAIYTSGGEVKHVYARGTSSGVPVRLYFDESFAVELQGPWAFLSDGMTYVAWAPTVGRPQRDSASEAPHGAFLVSSHTPGVEGETCLLEASDGATHGSFAAFKASVLARNPDPRLVAGVLRARTHRGATLTFGPDYVEVDGRRVNPVATSRLETPGAEGFLVDAGPERIRFDMALGRLVGDASRLPAEERWGAQAWQDPPGSASGDPSSGGGSGSGGSGSGGEGGSGAGGDGSGGSGSGESELETTLSSGQARAYLGALYRDVLGRTPSAAELARDLPLLARMSRGAFVESLQARLEARRLRVGALYERYLARRADSSGLASHSLDLGVVAQEGELAATLLASAEVRDRIPEDRAWVRYLLRTSWTRTPTSGELREWRARLAEGRAALALSAQASPQALDADVAAAHRALLGRRARAAELASWRARFEGGATRTQLRRALLSSPEYLHRTTP